MAPADSLARLRKGVLDRVTRGGVTVAKATGDGQLHLHYRTAFRYRYYVNASDVGADLQAWLRHYNFERPHRGYRTAGRTPASVFYAHRPSLLKLKGWDPNERRIRARAV